MKEWPILKKQKAASISVVAEIKELLYTVNGNVNWYNIEISLNTKNGQLER